MEKELKIIYEKLAETFEKWYEVDKENTVQMLCQYGHEHIFRNPSLLGLSKEQAEELKKAYEILVFYNKNKEVLENA